MENGNYFHMFANGADSQNFIITVSDYYAAFNLIGVCAANSPVKVISFSIEETHPHLLLFGQSDDCIRFMDMYRWSMIRHIVESRGDSDNVHLNFHLSKVDSKEYLQNVAIYSIIQPTKDGKRYMPYNYPWGTCSLYFKSEGTVPVWYSWPDGKYHESQTVGNMSRRTRHSILFSKKPVPDNWLVCNGFLLPSNYIDVKRFEEIFGTPNSFRVFLGNSSRKDDLVISKMAKTAGVTLEDYEANRICSAECQSKFGVQSARWLSAEQRLNLAHRIRRTHHLSIRQIAKFCRIPKKELEKYFR